MERSDTRMRPKGRAGHNVMMFQRVSNARSRTKTLRAFFFPKKFQKGSNIK